MVNYQDMHDILQVQLDSENITMKEATLVDDLVFIHSYDSDELLPFNTSFYQESKETRAQDKETLARIKRIQTDIRRIQITTRKQIKNGDLEEALFNINRLKIRLNELKKIVESDQFPNRTTIKTVYNIIAMVAVSLMVIFGATALITDKMTKNEEKKRNALKKEMEAEKEGMERDVKEIDKSMEEDPFFQGPDPNSKEAKLGNASDLTAKIAGASAGTVIHAKQMAHRYASSKKILLDYINRMIVKTDKMEQKIKKIVNKTSKKIENNE